MSQLRRGVRLLYEPGHRALTHPVLCFRLVIPAGNYHQNARASLVDVLPAAGDPEAMKYVGVQCASWNPFMNACTVDTAIEPRKTICG